MTKLRHMVKFKDCGGTNLTPKNEYKKSLNPKDWKTNLAKNE